MKVRAHGLLFLPRYSSIVGNVVGCVCEEELYAVEWFFEWSDKGDWSRRVERKPYWIA